MASFAIWTSVVMPWRVTASSIKPSYPSRFGFKPLPSACGLLACALTVAICIAPTRAAAVAFYPLSMSKLALAHGVSDDGVFAVGQSHFNVGDQFATRWTIDGSARTLGNIPRAPGYKSAAYDASANGGIVVGRSDSTAGQQAFRWIAGVGMTGLGDLSGGSFLSSAYGVSADGAIVVGSSSSSAGTQAFRWTQGSGMVGLGDLPGGVFYSIARAISPDGSVIVGYSRSSLGFEAFRWTSSEGMVGLGDLPGGVSQSLAYGTSLGGAAIVGQGYSSNGNEAFRWTASEGMVGLGDLPGGTHQSTAYGVSADGSVVVGSASAESGPQAFLWTSNLGMVDLQEYLVSHGVTNLSGWTLSYAKAVSSNGLTIVGTGRNPDGQQQGWLVTVPEPSGIALAAVALVGLAVLCRHKWRGSTTSTSPGKRLHSLIPQHPEG